MASEVFLRTRRCGDEPCTKPRVEDLLHFTSMKKNEVRFWVIEMSSVKLM